MSQPHGYEGVGEVDAEELLNLLELDNVHSIGRGEIAFSCPNESGHTFGDANPSNHMNEESLLWRCKGCGWSGHALQLVGAVRHCTPLESLRWLREHFGETWTAPKEGGMAAEMRALEQRLEKRRQGSADDAPRLPHERATQLYLDLDWRSDHDAAVYMRGRGFDSDLLTSYGLGWDSYTSRIAIPIRDHAGRLLGYKGRTINPLVGVRYKLLGDIEGGALRYGVGYGFDMHETENVVFNLDRAIQANAHLAPLERAIVVVEGEFNVLACMQAGIHNVVAIGMSSLSKGQAKLLRQHAHTAILYLDDDLAGQRATWGFFDEKDRWHAGIAERLMDFMRVLVVRPHERDAADELEVGQPENIRSLISTAVPALSYDHVVLD